MYNDDYNNNLKNKHKGYLGFAEKLKLQYKIKCDF